MGWEGGIVDQFPMDGERPSLPRETERRKKGKKEGRHTSRHGQLLTIERDGIKEGTMSDERWNGMANERNLSTKTTPHLTVRSWPKGTLAQQIRSKQYYYIGKRFLHTGPDHEFEFRNAHAPHNQAPVTDSLQSHSQVTTTCGGNWPVTTKMEIEEGGSRRSTARIASGTRIHSSRV